MQTADNKGSEGLGEMQTEKKCTGINRESRKSRDIKRGRERQAVDN